jgi:hypothetical protein
LLSFGFYFVNLAANPNAPQNVNIYPQTVKIIGATPSDCKFQIWFAVTIPNAAPPTVSETFNTFFQKTFNSAFHLSLNSFILISFYFIVSMILI